MSASPWLTTDPGRTGNRWPALDAGAILGGLATASLVELLILRAFTRTAIHIPAIAAMQTPFEVATIAGRFAYFAAIVLMTIALPATAVLLWRRQTAATQAAAAATGIFMVIAVSAATNRADRALLDSATVATIGLLAVSTAASFGGRRSAVFLLFGAASVAAGLHTALQSAGQEHVVGTAGGQLLAVAELAGVAFALASLALDSAPITRGVAIAAAAVAAVTGLAFAAEGGSTARILLLWNGGLQGALPAVVYAAAAGALAATFLRLYRAQQFAMMAGLTLLLTGGLGLHNTYQTGLVVTGFAALQLARAGRGAHSDEEPGDVCHSRGGA